MPDGLLHKVEGDQGGEGAEEREVAVGENEKISEDCSNKHLHIPKHMRMSQIVSAPPLEVTLPESGGFEQSSTPSNVNFHA